MLKKIIYILITLKYIYVHKQKVIPVKLSEILVSTYLVASTTVFVKVHNCIYQKRFWDPYLIISS